MQQPFTHDDLYALLQLAARDATAVQSNGAQAVVDRMRQFMSAQLAEKLPQYDVFVHISVSPYSFDVGSWMNKVKTDASGQVAACTVTWAGAPGVLTGAPPVVPGPVPVLIVPVPVPIDFSELLFTLPGLFMLPSELPPPAAV